jgi:hypothetical protein
MVLATSRFNYPVLKKAALTQKTLNFLIKANGADGSKAAVYKHTDRAQYGSDL